MTAGKIQETYRKAMEFFEQGLDEQALAKLEEAVRHEHAQAEAHFVLADVHELLGNRNRALEEYRRAVASRQNFVEAQNNLGVLLHKLNGLEDAAEALREAVRMDPYRLQSHVNLGLVLLKQGKTEAAQRQAWFVNCCDPEIGQAFSEAMARGGDGFAPLSMDHDCRYQTTDKVEKG